ncbi:MAG TPA: hypothetical protein VIZ43_22345 [Trebonia sp.]
MSLDLARCAHLAGTVRCVADPATSVLNADCRVGGHLLERLG